MKLSRASRFAAALVTLFSLLFTQLAVAAYACPGLTPAPAAISASTKMGDMAGCKGMDKNQDALCTAHCEVGHQSLDTPGTPHVQPFIAAELAIVLVDAPQQGVPRASSDSNRLTRATAPPLSIRNCCFRN